MPRWDFECEKCGHVVELMFRSFSEAAQNEKFCFCPKCDGDLYRLPSAPSFTISGYSSKNNYSRG